MHLEPVRRSAVIRELARTRSPADWQALIDEHGSPLLVLDQAVVAEDYAAMQIRLPYVRFHYAIKAQPHRAVLGAVADLNGYYDVASRGEVTLVRSLGIDMTTCVYSHPIKKQVDIDFAYSTGVRLFVVDNEVELTKFIGRPTDIELLVRVAFSNPHAAADLSVKFGADPAEVGSLVQTAIANGLVVAGMCFHAGSQGPGVEPFQYALATTLDLMRTIEATQKISFRTIDIGGGFPVDYCLNMPSFEEFALVVDELLGPHRHRLVILAEPGRSVSARCITLLTSVVGSAVRDGTPWHYLDDGIYGSYSNIVMEGVTPAMVALSELKGDICSQTVTLAGPTCDSIDTITTEHQMPALSIGDIVISPMMGAYTSVSASSFNGIATTNVVVVRGRRHRDAGLKHVLLPAVNGDYEHQEPMHSAPPRRHERRIGHVGNCTHGSGSTGCCFVQ